MTIQEAKALAVRETAYCCVLACAWEGEEKDSVCLERIFTKERGVEEIRLAWWNNRNQAPRPADIDAVNWVNLFEKAVQQGVFNDSEKIGMQKALMR